MNTPARSNQPAQAAKALALECQLSDLAPQAYGLTPEEVALMWHARPAPHAPHTP